LFAKRVILCPLRNKDDLLNKEEFVVGMTSHPVMAKILSIKTIDALLETF
jgi:hypothetical protein